MHLYQAGGSTQHDNQIPSLSRPARASRASPITTALVGGLLAGCQAFVPKPPEPDADGFGTLISPLAGAAIGGPAAIVPPSLDPVEMLPAPTVELDPVPTLAPTDVLERLRAEFSLPGSSDAAVKSELEWFGKHPEQLARVLTRAAPYLHYIAEELDARGMPADLALLPFIESAFDPFAYSRGRAAGLWQIIPGTAQRLNVKQNWWFDGRRDVVESTRGALDYLEALHAMFDGDWLLAIAGYNSGEGNVARALTRAAAAGRPGDFWGIRTYLPRETRTYVPRLLAIRDLVEHAERYGIDLPPIPNEPYFAVVETGGQIDIGLAAELAGVESDELYRLNAGFNRFATDPDGPHRLLLPVTHAENFAVAVGELGSQDRVLWTRHRIQSGETLSHIADRYATTPAVLRELNGLRGNLIRAGDYLMIPRARQAYDGVLLASARSGGGRDGERVVHVVRSGDSLWSISRRYGVDVRALASWNGMTTSDTLSIGRELVVLVGEGAVPLQASASAASLGPRGQNTTRRVNYVVRRGDSLSSIASRFRVSVSQLLEWNAGLSASRYLQPGQQVVMFVDVTEQST